MSIFKRNKKEESEEYFKNWREEERADAVLKNASEKDSSLAKERESFARCMVELVLYSGKPKIKGSSLNSFICNREQEGVINPMISVEGLTVVMDNKLSDRLSLTVDYGIPYDKTVEIIDTCESIHHELVVCIKYLWRQSVEYNRMQFVHYNLSSEIRLKFTGTLKGTSTTDPIIEEMEKIGIDILKRMQVFVPQINMTFICPISNKDEKIYASETKYTTRACKYTNVNPVVLQNYGVTKVSFSTIMKNILSGIRRTDEIPGGEIKTTFVEE